MFTDGGIGFGGTSLKTTIANLKLNKSKTENRPDCLPFSQSSKLSFICLNSPSDPYTQFALTLYQELLDVSGQNGQIFVPKSIDDHMMTDVAKKEDRTEANLMIAHGQIVHELIVKVCDSNYKQFEAVLVCGGYIKLESPVIIWPPPLPYTATNKTTTDSNNLISRRLEICGYLALADIGSPMSVSRHLILPKIELAEKNFKYIKNGSDQKPINEYDKLESDIKIFYSKNDNGNSDDESGNGSGGQESTKESVCVLLHGALKVENMAALVLLNTDWFGFIYSYADSKKKSNLMLTVLPPGMFFNFFFFY